MANKPVPIVPSWTPRTFTSAEAMLDEVRREIFADQRKYADIAKGTGVAASTIGNIASGKTKWPRSTTLFPLLETLGYRLAIQRKTS